MVNRPPAQRPLSMKDAAMVWAIWLRNMTTRKIPVAKQAVRTITAPFDGAKYLLEDEAQLAALTDAYECGHRTVINNTLELVRRARASVCSSGNAA